MPDQDDIDRAKQGKDAWNDWSAQNPSALVDFSGAQLTDISFAGFQFPGESNFTGAAFPDMPDFTRVTFSDRADFTEATFSDRADFTRVTFSDRADFTEATFSDGADFTRATFSDMPDFTKAAFSARADFTKAKFSALADFAGAKFSALADFTGATFSDRADFSRVGFLSLADFTRARFFALADFTEATFSDRVDFTEGLFFREVYFDGSQFGDSFMSGPVDFSKREFKGPTFFRDAEFRKIPLFHGASIHQFTIFGDIDKFFTDFRSQGAEHGYRTLKLAMSQQQARTEEAAFAALELKARRYRLKSEAREKKLGWQRFLSWAERCGYCLWEKLSDSGRSFFLPFALYLAFWCAFAASYVLLPTCMVYPPIYGLCLQSRNWCEGFGYSILKQLPFAAAFRDSSDRIGALEEKLFYLNGDNLPPSWVDALNIAQSIFALALIFLMGLGIRHKFRLRG